MIREEKWKTVEGFPNYKISDKGNVRSYGKLSMKDRIDHRVKLLSLVPGHRGHLQVNLCRKNRVYQKLVHRLVLEAFIGKCPDGYQTNHIDGNPQNNMLENLEWVTPSENARHAFAFGLRSHVGERHPRARLKDGEVWLMKKLLCNGIDQKLICRMFKISLGNLHQISSGIIWSHIEYAKS